MPRRPTGQIIEHTGADGLTYRRLRFTAGGKRRFVSLGAVGAAEAERELRHVLADVERGTWRPADRAPAPVEMPTFHEFAEQWWLRNEGRFAAKTHKDYRWRLEQHLLPHFADKPLDGITFDLVETYVAAKLAEGTLGASSINKTVILLAAILETAVERELIARNPAKGKGRRVRERAPRRSYLDTAEQIRALLDAAGELDAEATRERAHVHRRATVAVLALGGLRIGELCALRWRDIDLASGWLHVQDAKTDAGRRSVKLRGALRDELLTLRATVGAVGDSAGYVFQARGGGRMSEDNVRARVIGGSVKRANRRLAENDLPPLPEGISPHSLRRTFASVLCTIGEDPGTVMDEMGHTDPAFTLRVYRQSMRRDDSEKARLRALVEGADLALIGIRTDAPAAVEAGRSTQ